MSWSGLLNSLQSSFIYIKMRKRMHHLWHKRLLLCSHTGCVHLQRVHLLMIRLKIVWMYMLLNLIQKNYHLSFLKKKKKRRGDYLWSTPFLHAHILELSVWKCALLFSAHQLSGLFPSSPFVWHHASLDKERKVRAREISQNKVSVDLIQPSQCLIFTKDSKYLFRSFFSPQNKLVCNSGQVKGLTVNETRSSYSSL